MNPAIRAVVFRTCKLAATKAFFIGELGFPIRESSPTHFVIHSKGIRLLFVESAGEPEVEIYLGNTAAERLTVLEDPNHIKIIMSQHPNDDH
jgi:hypothetical protein